MFNVYRKYKFKVKTLDNMPFSRKKKKSFHLQMKNLFWTPQIKSDARTDTFTHHSYLVYSIMDVLTITRF